LTAGRLLNPNGQASQPSDIPRKNDRFLEPSGIGALFVPNKSIARGKLFWQSLDFGVKYAVVKLNESHF
jgi:hypothetical protein